MKMIMCKDMLTSYVINYECYYVQVHVIGKIHDAWKIRG